MYTRMYLHAVLHVLACTCMKTCMYFHEDLHVDTMVFYGVTVFLRGFVRPGAE